MEVGVPVYVIVRVSCREKYTHTHIHTYTQTHTHTNTHTNSFSHLFFDLVRLIMGSLYNLALGYHIVALSTRHNTVNIKLISSTCVCVVCRVRGLRVGWGGLDAVEHNQYVVVVIIVVVVCCYHCCCCLCMLESQHVHWSTVNIYIGQHMKWTKHEMVNGQRSKVNAPPGIPCNSHHARQ